ncbi:LiaI-LiaF-like domain-containing protein [Peribacillus sp. NPDC096379]|uniref:LiaI-LiaF-like domain-containing protein n=1 Tax=Peribacillus sp. NPDC096379 TaxID=3364393 RepID=UPI003813A8DD
MMKTQRIFPGIILLGFGLYFLLQQYNLVLFEGFFNWPTVLCIIGAAFLGEAYGGKQFQAILPGVILFGTGLHYHLVDHLAFWPNHIGVLQLIVAIGFLMQASKTKSSLTKGILLLIIAIITVYYDQLISKFGLSETALANSASYWPFLVMGIGIYILFIKKK